jgi:hypothetical protein
MSVVAPPTSWPSDPGHREAIDTLLVMAEAEDRWGEPMRAAELLESAERMLGTLPRRYDRIRRRCRDGRRRWA